VAGALRGAVAALGLVLAGWPLAAVGQTVIAPDVAAGRGLGTTVGQTGTVFAIDGGTRAGPNLFHSFSQFDLAAGNTASWVRSAGDGGSIANVVNRVTGGTASTIAGTLDSTALPNAAFYFINPAGIVFGAGAQVNVPGAAHFSTAADLRFADGTRFAVATPNGSTLSVAAPEAFGFVGGQGDITVADVGVAFAAGNKPLAFSAANVAFTNANFGVGGLDVTAVGARSASVRLSDPLVGTYAGEIRLRDSVLNSANVDAPVGSFRLAAGLIDFDDARLVSDTAGAAAGADMRLKAGSIRLGRDSLLVTSSRGGGHGGQVEITAGDLVLDGTGSTTFTAGITSVATVSGDAGLIRLTADNFLTQGGAFIGSSVSGSADAGNVEITANNFVVDNAFFNTATLPGSSGRGADIRLRANAFDLGAANVTTQAFGSGRAGDVILEGGSLVLSGGSLGSTPGGVADSGNLTINLTGRLEADGGFLGVSTFSSDSAAAAGTITIRSSGLFMQGTLLNTQAGGLGAPGRVLIDTGEAVLDEVFYIGDAKDGVGEGLFRLRATGDIFMRNGFFTSNANGLGNGGVIEIQGRNIDLITSIIQSETNPVSLGAAGRVLVIASGDLNLESTLISSSTDGAGKAGDVRVEARNISLDLSSALRSDALGGSDGDAGSVSVLARTLHLQDASTISSESQLGATGDAGAVFIDVGSLTLATAASISSTTSSSGVGGTVNVRADEILLLGEQQGFTSILSETFGDGRGGNINIAAGKLTLDGGALISTVSRFDANAGGIVLDVGELSVLNGSAIATVAFGVGKSGDIEITADKLEVRSDDRFFPSAITSAGVRGGGGNIRLDVGSLLVDYGQISSDTTEEGDAGGVRIEADTITLRTFSSISSSTQGFGNAGSMDIQAKSLVLEEGTAIISAATRRSTGGNAGSISVVADNIVVGDEASINTSTLSLGDAGQVAIRAKSLRVDGGFISSSAEIGSAGQARDVQVTADNLAVVNRGSIDTISANPNPAGTVRIQAGTLLVDGLSSAITSENIAGDPVFTAPMPGGNAGTILITADNLTISNGARVSTNSFGGAAGDINVSIRRPGLFILQGGELPGFIQTSSGPGTGGRITISDPLAVISNGGLIQALGEQRGANVVIQSRYFIGSSDRLNAVDVAGETQIQADLYDVSSGTVSRDLSVLDASKVLRGQCPAARSTGAVSQLITRPVGPYAREPAIDVLRAPPPGGCP
jgi:filamentous hemagglutinin family protein